MSRRTVMTTKPKHSRVGPAITAIAVASFGLLALVLVDHGPWSKPQVQNSTMIEYGTTAGAAAAVDATVTDTAPKQSIEPAAPGPKPVQPAIPDASKG